MAQNGAIIDSLSGTLGSIDPAFALIAGIALGVGITLGWSKFASIVRSPRFRKTADPLSGLFEGSTLESQLTRVADPQARSEIKDRQASAVRAKIFARKSAMAPPKDTPAPHRATRYDHGAVLAHVAKVMRAGTHLDEPASASDACDDAAKGEWEEVLLLPPPSGSDTKDEISKAA